MAEQSIQLREALGFGPAPVDDPIEEFPVDPMADVARARAVISDIG